MQIVIKIFGLLLAALLAACGGGGGSAGTTGASTGSGSNPTTGTSTVTVSSDLILKGVLQDATGVTTTSISASGFTLLNVTLTDSSGKGIANQVISVIGDTTKVVFPEGSGGLTNASGVATIKVARASLFATGADSLTVTYNYKAGTAQATSSGALSSSLDKLYVIYVGYQLSAANISLTSLNTGIPTLAAYGTRQVTVQANINGAAATSTPVQVSFSSNCGTVTPAIASTNSQGLVQISYSAINAGVTNDQGCSGSTVSIVASTTGATPVTGNLSIDLAPATNLLFVDAKPNAIFLAGSGGATQSIVRFRLVNASSAALQGQNVLLELKDLAGGIPKTTFGAIGNVTAITQPTNASGEVSVPVFSGTVPTNVVVKATLVSNVNVATTSAALAIASGRAVQSRVSLAIEKLSIEGANVDGVDTSVTLSLADRQGNPVPDGTSINFVTEGGVMIPPVCNTGIWLNPSTGLVQGFAGNSQCTVKIRSQNPRPADGRVSILAYAAGEKDFVDLNFDNVYSPGEPFTDLGNAFRDDAARVSGVTGPYVDGYFSVPRAGSVTCDGGFLGRPNSCSGVWGPVDVRQQGIIIFATGQSLISAVSQTGNNLTFSVSDLNLNSVPTGSAIVVTASPSTCVVDTGGKAIVANSLFPSNFSVSYSGVLGAPCSSGSQINVQVTTPLGLVTSISFPVPVPTPAGLTVLAGPNLIVASANSRTTTVSGGTGPYSVSSSAVSKATATLTGSTLTITGVAMGTANIVVTDAAGAAFTIAVTVN